LAVFTSNVEHVIAGTVIADLYRGSRGMRLGRREDIESRQCGYEASNFR